MKEEQKAARLREDGKDDSFIGNKTEDKKILRGV
jgi:hypothetical protein